MEKESFHAARTINRLVFSLLWIRNLLVDQLNEIRFGGFKLGFWFAQQGSIYTFIVLIFIYVVRMNQIDREFDVDEN
ncbi:hypothetical protein A3SI_07959 [Nitritalea halalkaliphila LW7]|uniref:Sodium symporter small subunit domain-containing protein n=1 Tax=Nitritalea halalkaliphila LW7 TaxID=1189621 RepID=I5C5U6_9BACT|nr:hypothetical protein A3SI_07959 [Nitritalea halalkaliphila LW7]